MTDQNIPLKNPKRWPKILLVILLIFGGLFWLIIRDDALQDFSDLKPELPTVIEGDNPLPMLMREVFGTVDANGEWTPYEITIPREWPETESLPVDEVKALLSLHRNRLDQWRGTLSTHPSGSWHKEPENYSESGPTDYSINSIKFFQLSNIEVKLELQQGNFSLAHEVSKSMWHLAKEQAFANTILLDLLVSQTAHSIAMQANRRVALSDECKEGGLREFMDLIVTDISKPMKNTVSENVYFSLNGTPEMLNLIAENAKTESGSSSEGLPAPLVIALKPNRTINQIATHGRMLIAAAEKGYPEVKALIEKTKEEWANRKQPFFTNRLGEPVIDEVVEVLGITVRRAYIKQTESQATILMLALRLFHLENNDLPDKLDDLVPRYLPELPIDLFANAPWHYDKRSGTIYCVGKDGIDNGGEITTKTTRPPPIEQWGWTDLAPDFGMVYPWKR